MTEEAKTCISALRMIADCKGKKCEQCEQVECYGTIACIVPQKVYKHSANLIESLSEQLEQVTRERDAAVEELSYTRKCSICKKHLSEGGDCYGNHKCGNGNPDWQWRGVEVER